MCSCVTDSRTSKAGSPKDRDGAARPTQGYQHCPQYVSHPVAVVALTLASYPESHHSPQNFNSKHAPADRRCSATVTETEQQWGLQILRKIELMGFLHFNIVHSKQHTVLITKNPTTCTYQARKIHTYNISSYMFRL